MTSPKPQLIESTSVRLFRINDPPPDQGPVNPILTALDKASMRLSAEITASREKILEAFIAETGCLPRECEQVTVIDGNTIRWYV